MPEATVYQCDKTEGLRDNPKKPHLECGREVRDDDDQVVMLVVKVVVGRGDAHDEVLRFCRRSHANYWLVRQRVALGPEGAAR